MKQIIHRACLWVLGLWTSGCLAAAVLAAYSVPVELARRGLSPLAIEAALDAAQMVNFTIWGAVIVPLGILAVLTRAGPPGAPAITERRETAL